MVLIQRARKKTARPQHHDHQKRDVTREYLPFRIELGADGLREADNDAAGQRAPQAAEAADDDSLERVDQPSGPMVGSKLARMPRYSAAIVATTIAIPIAIA